MVKLNQKAIDSLIISYFQKTNVRPAKDGRQFYNIIKDKFGTKTLNRYNSIADNIAKDTNAMYKFKNESFELSMAFLSFCADKYRRVFGKVLQHIDTDTEANILDLGCDNGFGTCLMAYIFPNAKITGIDVCEDSLECANQLKKKLGLNNVNFLLCNANIMSDTFSSSLFDFVFSVHTIHEIIGVCHEDTRYFSLHEVEGKYSTELNYPVPDVMSQIHDVLSEEGSLISYERLSPHNNLLKYLYDLERAELCIDRKFSSIISYQQVGDLETSAYLVLNKSGHKVDSIADFILKLYTDEDFYPLIGAEYDENESEYLFYHLENKKFIFGFQIDYINEPGNIMRVEFWKTDDFFVRYDATNVGHRKIYIDEPDGEEDPDQIINGVPKSDDQRIIRVYRTLCERDQW